MTPQDELPFGEGEGVTSKRRPLRGSRNVGHSVRTPAKHALMGRLIGREVGAGRHIRGFDEHLWLDLTAGDGVPYLAEGPWWSNCSPGLLAYHATAAHKRIRVRLHEIQPATFDRLDGNLHDHLPRLEGRRGESVAYGWNGDHWWRGYSQVRSFNADGAGASVEDVTARTAVVVVNDPNAINTWAMRPTFVAEIRERTPWFRGISTMGCNAKGLKRLNREERGQWYGLVQQAADGLYPHHDLLLAAIERDDSQWAYLVEEANAWGERAEDDVDKAFTAHGMTMRKVWLRRDPAGFRALLDELFLTKKERM